MTEAYPFTCAICKKPVDMNRDYYADEKGKIVHEACYIQALISSFRYYPPDPHHTQ